MESNSNQDLPAEILDKLRNLELELEDGDITLKGFEKKKANLLADITSTSTPSSPRIKTDAEILEELGPEPSAADVVDFLDFLPSPTHSPPSRGATADIGANFMEENHRQLKQQPQQPYQTQPQQQQYQQQMRPIQSQPSQYRPYQQQGRPVMNNQPYFQGSPLPNNNGNRPPYMVARPQQPQQRIPGANPYYANQRPLPPVNAIPPQNLYRPTNNFQQPIQQQQRPIMYNNNSNIPQQTSPRPMYRPQPQPRPSVNMNYQNYRPQPQQQFVQPSNSIRNPDMQYGNYPSNNMNGVNRSLSTNTGINMTGKPTDQRQYQTMSMYTTRNDSMEWNQ